MTSTKHGNPPVRRFDHCSLLLLALHLTAATLVVSAGQKKEGWKVGTIDATATGTSTQLGSVVNVKVIIHEFSTEEDRAILVDAFKKGQNQGLVNALTKMKAVGRIAITGTLGYDLSFIRLIPTPTGRKIRFVTNRQLRFGEVYAISQTTPNTLTTGDI